MSLYDLDRTRIQRDGCAPRIIPMRANIVKPPVTQLEVDARSGLIESVASREVTAMDDQIIADGLLLTRAFFKIADAADRQKVIQLALSLARPGPKDAGAGASPPIASR